jgi:hypothetical protein
MMPIEQAPDLGEGESLLAKPSKGVLPSACVITLSAAAHNLDRLDAMLIGNGVHDPHQPLSRRHGSTDADEVPLARFLSLLPHAGPLSVQVAPVVMR